VALKTTLSMLEETQAAISALTIGGMQNYSLDGQTIGKLSLPALYDREERLLRRYYRETGARPKISEMNILSD